MSPPRLIVAAMMRNEANRFLEAVLSVWSRFADRIVILDDDSEDNSAEIAIGFDRVILHRRIGDGGPAWGAEAHPRKLLWHYALEEARSGTDWIFVLDCDMIPARSPRPLLETERPPDAVAFPLYDLWTADGREYRDDGLWKAHVNPRIWLLRTPVPPDEGWKWNERGIHCGHLPANIRFNRVLVAPRDYGLLHYAYTTPELRSAKFEQYDRIRSQLTELEKMHYESIVDPSPVLRPLPFEPLFLP